MKILVTGASGFIGSHLIRHLATLGHKVVAHSKSRAIIPSDPGVCLVKGDLTLPASIEGLPASVDVIVHLAQAGSFKEFPDQAKEIFSINASATLALLEYARKVGARRFVFTSTGNVYGSQPIPISEGGYLVPSDFYGASKLAAEALIGQYSRFFDVVILRLFAVYGFGQQPTRLIPRLVEAVRAGRPVMVNPNGGMKMNPTYIDDVVEVIARMLERHNSTCLNIGGPEALSVKEMSEIIGVTLGMVPSFRIQEGIPAPSLVPDITQMRTLFPPLPRITFREGIKRLAGPIPAVLMGGS